MNIYLSGHYNTKFGELWSVSPRQLAQDAVGGALKDSGLSLSDIDCLYVGNMLSGILGGQEHLGALFADEFGLKVPAVKIEGACASGGLAVHQAILSILSGIYKNVLVLGVEKMTDHKPDDVANALVGAGTESERRAGLTFPGLYALLAKVHMSKFKTTSKDLARVAVKNHYHASLNPKAQFHNLLNVDMVLNASKVADPLGLLDCSPISDGAAAIILSQEKLKSGKQVKIIASSLACDSLGLSGRKNLYTLEATVNSAKKAFKIANIKNKDIGVLEVHDCFTIAEILALEDLGFFEKGKVPKALDSGELTLGQSKKLVVNSSGGLKGSGHPVGATGVKQICEIADQLMGVCGERQVPECKYGMTHNVGGSGATAVVHILEV